MEVAIKSDEVAHPLWSALPPSVEQVAVGADVLGPADVAEAVTLVNTLTATALSQAPALQALASRALSSSAKGQRGVLGPIIQDVKAHEEAKSKSTFSVVMLLYQRRVAGRQDTAPTPSGKPRPIRNVVELFVSCSGTLPGEINGRLTTFPRSA